MHIVTANYLIPAMKEQPTTGDPTAATTPIWNNSNNDSLDILELLLNTSTQNSFHELSQKQ